MSENYSTRKSKIRRI